MPAQDTKPLPAADNFIKLFSSLGSAIIFLSILKSYVFYASFGIRITNYITFSEAILLFLNEIAVLLLYLLLLLALFTLLFYAFRYRYRHYTPIDVLVPARQAPLWHKLFCLVLLLYPLFYLFYAIVMNALHYSHFKMFAFLLLCFALIEVMLVLLGIAWWKKMVDRKYELQNSLFIYLVVICIIFFYTWSLERQLHLFHRNRINKTVIAVAKDSTQQLSSRDVQFLGATRNYVFCYNHREERSIVINVSGFDRIETGTYRELPGFSIFDLLFH